MKKIRYSQFAAMNMIYNKYSFGYFLDSMERLQIKNFELWTGAPHISPITESLRVTGGVRREVQKRGMHIVCVTPEQVMYPYNIAAPDRKLRDASLAYFRENIHMTAELGADKMLCCAGWGNYDEDPGEAWKRSVDGLWQMVETARKDGVMLAFEILNRTESNLVYDFATTKKMMEAISDPLLGLCVDTVPVRLEGNTLEDYFAEFGKRICHVHLTDGDPMGHVPCGKGTHPVREHLKALETYDYTGYITLEIGDTSESERPEEATAFGFATVRNYVNQ
ncbi:MAG: sugar phosphate isomerase/epimerase family protein [Eubacteriales bacterium]|nr:sugar phosphate isomerase/epimerase family protein [Eubacteriales bacterium]